MDGAGGVGSSEEDGKAQEDGGQGAIPVRPSLPYHEVPSSLITIFFSTPSTTSIWTMFPVLGAGEFLTWLPTSLRDGYNQQVIPVSKGQ